MTNLTIPLNTYWITQLALLVEARMNDERRFAASRCTDSGFDENAYWAFLAKEDAILLHDLTEVLDQHVAVSITTRAGKEVTK